MTVVLWLGFVCYNCFFCSSRKCCSQTQLDFGESTATWKDQQPFALTLASNSYTDMFLNGGNKSVRVTAETPRRRKENMKNTDPSPAVFFFKAGNLMIQMSLRPIPSYLFVNHTELFCR